jgi:hypothetical protein
MTLSALHRTLDQELVAILRSASLECPVCGEFLLHRADGIGCPLCGLELCGLELCGLEACAETAALSVRMTDAPSQ